MLGSIIGGFITILIGVTLMPIVADLIEVAKCNDGSLFNITGTGGYDLQFCNVSGASSVLLSLTSLFFAIAVMSVGVGMVTQGLNASGLM